MNSSNLVRSKGPKKKRKTLRFILIILGIIVFLCGGVMLFSLIISGLSSTTTVYGHTSRQNPAAFGTSTTEGEYTIIVTDVSSTTRSEDGRYYTLDGYRLIINGSITCNLPEGEICTMKKFS